MIFASMRNGEVHLLNPESGATVLVTSDDFTNYDAQLSPDGTWAAYVSERYGDADIWMRRIGVDVKDDADALRQLTTSTAADIWPAWSPDGARIVFASDRDEADRFDLYLIDVETKALTRLTTSGVNIYSTWAPGPDIVFASNREGSSAMDFDLYRMPSACLNAPETCEGALERITEGDRIDWSPAWSPDGTRIAYASAEAGTSTFQIFVRSLADGGSMQITTGDSLHQFPVWSPDGTQIAFVGIWSGARDIFIVPANAEAPPVERLTTGLGVESLRGWMTVPGQ
jgi:TolB protein